MIDLDYLNSQLELLKKDRTSEDAFCNLTELDLAYLPAIIERFNAEAAVRFRLALIRVIWEFRNPMAVPTLLAAVGDPCDEIVLAALDGLVTIGGELATIGMQEAISKIPEGSPRKAWIEEALEQTESARKLTTPISD